MRHNHTGSSPLGRAPRIRTLLARADHEPDQVARFWDLAIARQLIEEHLATLEGYLTRAQHPAQQSRCRRARRAWTGCLVTICARLDRARRDTTRD
jgi:hypothetical protein